MSTYKSAGLSTITTEAMVDAFGVENVISDKAAHFRNVSLANQLKAIKEAKDQGICYKCKEDVAVDVNGVCANCGGEHADQFGRGNTPHSAIINLLDASECEVDCNHICSGCDRLFHNIKVEDYCDHSKELPEAHRTNAGNYYCHSDCGRK